MATVSWADTKQSFRYSMQVGNEVLSRTVSGLNTNDGNVELGPSYNAVTTGLINTINSLSNSNVSNPRYIIELAVEQ